MSLFLVYPSRALHFQSQALQLLNHSDLPFLLLLLWCPRTTAKAPSDLVSDIDLHLQFLRPIPHERWILLKHPACDDEVQTLVEKLVRLYAAGDGSHCCNLGAGSASTFPQERTKGSQVAYGHFVAHSLFHGFSERLPRVRKSCFRAEGIDAYSLVTRPSFDLLSWIKTS